MTVFWRSGVEDVLCRSAQQPHNPVLEGAPIPTRTLQAAHGGWKARLHAIVDGQRTEMRPVSTGLTSGLKGPRMRVRQLAMLVYPYFGTDAERARVRPHFIRRETRLWTGSWAWLLEAWNAHPRPADAQRGEPGDSTQAALRGVCATTWPTYSTACPEARLKTRNLPTTGSGFRSGWGPVPMDLHKQAPQNPIPELAA